MSDWMKQLIAREGAHTVRHKSALNPLNWLCATVCPPCVGAAAYAAINEQAAIAIALLVLGLIPVIAFVGIYIFWMISDPSRLHSEEFLLQSRALDIVESKSGSFQPDQTTIGNTLNPYALPPSEGSEQ